jgi:hypothetical protein
MTTLHFMPRSVKTVIMDLQNKQGDVVRPYHLPKNQTGDHVDLGKCLSYTVYEHVFKNHECCDGKDTESKISKVDDNTSIHEPIAIHLISITLDNIECIVPLISSNPNELFKKFEEALVSIYKKDLEILKNQYL